MTWKSTAAASGVMVVATWLASHAPVGGPREQPAVSTSRERAETAAAELQREAERLHDRLQQVATYKLPTRNPFRFAARPQQAIAPRQPVAPVPEAPAVVDVAPAPPALILSGIGEDGEGEQVVRTAIISTATDVHVVRAGDTIDGLYKVESIAADSVDIVRLDDGNTLRLSLRR